MPIKAPALGRGPTHSSFLSENSTTRDLNLLVRSSLSLFLLKNNFLKVATFLTYFSISISPITVIFSYTTTEERLFPRKFVKICQNIFSYGLWLTDNFIWLHQPNNIVDRHYPPTNTALFRGDIDKPLHLQSVQHK